MFIELVDVLRCPNAHEETWLVLAADEIDGRDVMAGTLGCPTCHAEFPIRAGIAHFDNGSAPRARSLPSDEDEAVRLAALLDLTDARGYAILIGETGSHAPRLRELTDVQLMLVDPPPGIRMGAGLSGLTSTTGSHVLPLAPESARALAVDSHATPELLESVLTAVEPGGRVLAPVSLTLPDGLTEMARDDRHWLAERQRIGRSSGIVSIRRRD